MNPLKKLLEIILDKAKDELGIEFDKVKAAQFLSNVFFPRIPEAELTDWLDEMMKGKMISETLTDIGINVSVKELKKWADETAKGQ